MKILLHLFCLLTFFCVFNALLVHHIYFVSLTVAYVMISQIHYF